MAASRRAPAPRSRPVQVLRRVDVHEQEIGFPEPPELSLDVLHRIHSLQEFAHGAHSAIERRPHARQYVAVVGGAQRMDPPPPKRYDGRDAAPLEAFEEVAHQLRRYERHVARRYEDEPVPRGCKTGLHPGERSEAAGPLAGDPARLLQPRSLPAPSHHYRLRAPHRERVADAAEYRYPTHLEEQLVATHPAARSARENDPRGKGTQDVACGTGAVLR